MNIGKNIRKIRELKNLTQEHMASRLGMSQKSYSNIENSKTKPDIDQLQLISSALDISLEKLLSFDEQYVFHNKNSNCTQVSNVAYYDVSEQSARCSRI